MPANLENSAVATGLEKVSFHSKPKKGNPKECSSYCTIALISHTNKVMFKILQARLQQYMDQYKLVFKKAKSSRRPSISVLLTIPKPLTVWITINCGKF